MNNRQTHSQGQYNDVCTKKKEKLQSYTIAQKHYGIDITYIPLIKNI